MAEAYVGEIRLFSFNYQIQDWIPCDGRQLQIQNYQALYGAIGLAFGGDGQTVFNVPDLRGRVPVGAGAGTGLPQVGFAQPFGTATTVLSPAQVPLPPHTHATAVTDPGHTHTAALPAHTHPVAVPCDGGSASSRQATPQGAYLSTTSSVLEGINTAIDQANAVASATALGGEIPTIPDVADVVLYATSTDSTMASFDSGPASATTSSATGSAGTGITVQVATAAAPASTPVALQPPSLGMNYMICINGFFPVRY